MHLCSVGPVQKAALLGLAALAPLPAACATEAWPGLLASASTMLSPFKSLPCRVLAAGLVSCLGAGLAAALLCVTRWRHMPFLTSRHP